LFGTVLQWARCKDELSPRASTLGFDGQTIGLPSPLASWYAHSVRSRPIHAQTLFVEMVLEQVDSLYCFALRLTGKVDEAEELVQETFVRAIAAEKQFTQGSNLRAWLFRILRNRHIDDRRRERRIAESELDEELFAVSNLEPTELLRGDLETSYLRRVVIADIEAALLRLNEDARTVVLLELEGFQEAEIAQILECASGTVKSRLARARANLRQLLSGYAK
jgi:RNA polymerase sigma-70 factor (ECF subfamily)